MPNDLNAMKKYNLTHYELIEFTHKLAFSVRRDILEFADYNVTEADVDNMITFRRVLHMKTLKMNYLNIHVI